MEERKLNKNALRSKALIREAFLELLKVKHSVDITVTDIVKKADINRATFYAHYGCIADVITEFEDEIINKLTSVLSEFSFTSFIAEPSKYPTRLLLEVSKFIDENLNTYKTIIENADTNEFINKLSDIFVQYFIHDESIPKEAKQDKKFLVHTYYVAGGISSVFLNWIKGKINCSIYDLPIELSEIIMQSPKENIQTQ